jgi:uncharacterized membrane protein YfcA
MLDLLTKLLHQLLIYTLVYMLFGKKINKIINEHDKGINKIPDSLLVIYGIIGFIFFTFYIF